MLDILTTYAYQDAVAFPNTGAVDSSGPLTTDGTEFIAAMINDFLWGPMQSLLDYTGQTPNGTVESPSNSQYLEAHRRAFSYPGEIIAAAWNDDPATLGIRAIKMIGQGILRANYPELDAAVYCGDGNNATASAFFRADDAGGVTRNTAGVYLILPDARGYFIRGLDTAAGIDPDGASRDLGSIQDFAIENITGSFYARSDEGGSALVAGESGVFAIAAGASHTAITTYAGNSNSQTVTFDASTVINTDTETRGINIAFDLYIRY
jgi:hypothetical protein